MLHVRAEVDETLEWWRPLVQPVRCIPHLLYNGLATAASIVAYLVSLPIVLVTGRMPARLAAFQVAVLRERARTFAYLFALRRSAPPFVTRASAVDPGDDPALVLSVDGAGGRVPRSAPLVRLLTVLPHVVVLLPIGLCLDALFPLWMLFVAANRGWPAGMARSLASIERWVVAIILYATMASDERPHFGLAFDRATITPV